jgi:hypothetical protein
MTSLDSRERQWQEQRNGAHAGNRNCRQLTPENKHCDWIFLDPLELPVGRTRDVRASEACTVSWFPLLRLPYSSTTPRPSEFSSDSASQQVDSPHTWQIRKLMHSLRTRCVTLLSPPPCLSDHATRSLSVSKVPTYSTHALSSFQYHISMSSVR